MAHTGYYSDLSSFANVDQALQQAELYKDQAEVSATTAAASAVTAVNAEVLVAASATSATESATLATNAATAAETSSTVATTAATNATTQATNAATSATAASGSATAASASAATATTQATNASASATTATTQASNASASAATASTAATTATTQATNASASATAASGSATTATTQASNASGSATTATTQATNASASATAAAGSATAAATSATEAAASAAAAIGVPRFMVMWYPLRSAIPVGYIAADGQTLSRTTYAAAWTDIQASKVPTVADATWVSTNTERGKYTVGDGSTTFRVPDYNGKSASNIGAVFLRGDGTNSSGTAGVIQPSQNLSHNHTASGAGHVHSGGIIMGSNANTAGAAYGPLSSSVSTGNSGVSVTVNADGGTEARPINVTGVFVIKIT